MLSRKTFFSGVAIEKHPTLNYIHCRSSIDVVFLYIHHSFYRKRPHEHNYQKISVLSVESSHKSFREETNAIANSSFGSRNIKSALWFWGVHTMIAHEYQIFLCSSVALYQCTVSNRCTSIVNWMTSRHVPEAGGEIRCMQWFFVRLLVEYTGYC